MACTAIVLAGGSSSRLGQEKGLVNLGGKPLVKYVLDAARHVADEVIVVVSSEDQLRRYSHAFNSDAEVIADDTEAETPLAGAVTGLRHSKDEYSLLLSCDTPFVSKDVLFFLVELCVDRSAAIPRWPNCNIEPLQAAYRTSLALDAAQKALGTGQLSFRALIDKLRQVRYVSTLVFEQLDPGLKTFYNVNTTLDLKKAETLLKR